VSLAGWDQGLIQTSIEEEEFNDVIIFSPDCPILVSMSLILNCGLTTIDCGLTTIDCGLITIDCGLITIDCGLITIDCGLIAHNCKLFIY